MNYRPEIDGLRAIAVLSVIFYHAGFVGFSGGFVGVDIFFVISGFLISNILLQKIQAGTFSYANFYDRRARRILPMVFVMILVAIPLGLLTMLTDQFEDFCDTILSSIFFYSNFLFLNDGGYWGGDNALKPLLHTWSLSVEEQFYIFFPPILFLCWKFALKYLSAVLIAGLFLSLIVAEWASHYYPLESFFLLPTRAFELLAGAILASLQLKYGRKEWKYGSLMSALGIMLIVGSVFFFQDTMFHPSILTLIPVGGAMLIIWFAGQKDFSTKILSTRLFVGIGLISYSLYLWHHILFAFARIKSAGDLSELSMVGLIIITIILSYLSWRFVETPFRDKARISIKKFWIIVLSMTVLVSGFSFFAKEMDGFPQRLPSLAKLANAAADKSPAILSLDGKKCDSRTVEQACSVGAADSKTKWVLLGDSHLSLISSALWEVVEGRNEDLITYINDGCFYAPGMEVREDGKPKGCNYQTNMRRREKLLAMESHIVVMGGRMPVYLSGEWFDNGEGGIEDTTHFYMRPHDQELPEEERKKAIEKAVKQGVEELLKVGHKVVLIYPIPEVGVNVPQLIGKMAMSKSFSEAQEWLDNGGVNTSYDVYKKRSADSYVLYDSIGDHPNLLRFYPEKIFCNNAIKGRCSTYGEEGIYYSDDDHLSLTGSRLFVDKLMTQIKKRWKI